jgi:hypothetical protein
MAYLDRDVVERRTYDNKEARWTATISPLCSEHTGLASANTIGLHI